MDLPDAKNREKILRVILKDEELEDGFDFAELAAITEGYSGSDLKVNEWVGGEGRGGVDGKRREGRRSGWLRMGVGIDCYQWTVSQCVPCVQRLAGSGVDGMGRRSTEQGRMQQKVLQDTADASCARTRCSEVALRHGMGQHTRQGTRCA